MLRVPTALLVQHVLLAIRLSVKHNEQVILRISGKYWDPRSHAQPSAELRATALISYWHSRHDALVLSEPAGHFLKDDTHCNECGASCAANQYESQACSTAAEQDRGCTGMQYKSHCGHN